MVEWVKIELGHQEAGHLVFGEREDQLGLPKAREVLLVAGSKVGRLGRPEVGW